MSVEQPSVPSPSNVETDTVHSHTSPSNRSTGLVGFAVLTSRILGLVREQICAVFFGAGFEYDAFVTAFRIPNLLRDLFAEGALSAAFLTVFTEKLETKGEPEAWLLASRVLNLLLLLLLPTVFAGIVFSPQIVDTIAPGFGITAEKRALTIYLAQWMWPFGGLVFIAAWMMGLLTVKERFLAPSFASAIFNVGAVLGGLICAFLAAPQYVTAVIRHLWWRTELAGIPGATQAVFGMALGTLIGGVLQILIQMPSLFHTGFRYVFSFGWNQPDVRRVFTLLIPVVLGGAATQINVFVNSNFASELGDGRVGWLNYAFRLIQFPIGVFGVAIATTSLPGIARAAVRKEIVEFNQRVSHALGLVFVLCIPSACGLAILGNLIVSVIYEHGKFTAGDTRETAAALACYAIGLAGYAAIKVLAPAFYALGDTRTPVWVSLISIVLNYIFNLVLVRKLQFGHTGLALSTAGVILAEFMVFLLILRFHTHLPIVCLQGRRLLKILMASAVLAVTAWAVSRMWVPVTSGGRMTQLGIAITGSSLLFAVTCKVLGIDEFIWALQAFGGNLAKRIGTVW
ncbi:MAG: murein biosynthesis integral membrane protein MurJ [Blastocatellia bacterium]|nr:murein biosynthesis integral membrane protein MurJ [Blastocatellia bacterium]